MTKTLSPKFRVWNYWLQLRCATSVYKLAIGHFRHACQHPSSPCTPMTFALDQLGVNQVTRSMEEVTLSYHVNPARAHRRSQP